MTHEDAGNYAAKRPGAILNEMIASEIKEKTAENKISCAKAHDIAVRLKTDPSDVGAAIDLLEVRINKCQLGLFGHVNKKNIPVLPDSENPEIESAVRAALVNGRIACAAAWEISRKFKVSKALVSAVCENMKVKISSCQLGAFR